MVTLKRIFCSIIGHKYKAATAVEAAREYEYICFQTCKRCFHKNVFILRMEKKYD